MDAEIVVADGVETFSYQYAHNTGTEITLNWDILELRVGGTTLDLTQFTFYLENFTNRGCYGDTSFCPTFFHHYLLFAKGPNNELYKFEFGGIPIPDNQASWHDWYQERGVLSYGRLDTLDPIVSDYWPDDWLPPAWQPGVAIRFDDLTQVTEVLDELVNGTDQGDLLSGENGNDTIYGNGGQDSLYGDNGNDVLYGGDDRDTLFGGDGDDHLLGGGGNDRTLFGQSGNDTIDGGDGFDQADYDYAPAGINVDLAAGTAQDGYGYTDTLISIESIDGSDFDDTIRGDDQDNYLVGNAGNDTIDGRGGLDQVSYLSANTGVQVDLQAGTANDGFGTVDTLVSIEEAQGSDFADVLNGSSGNNLLAGYDGNDTLRGLNGKDFLLGYDGNDSLIGGLGKDTLIGDAGNDTLLGGGGNDSLYASLGQEVLKGGAGTDTLVFTKVLRDAPNGAYTGFVNLATGVIGVREDASISSQVSGIENVLGTRISDDGTALSLQVDTEFTGNKVANRMTGGTGNDTLSGGKGGDNLSGNAGNDRAIGGKGFDTLFGGSGHDSLFGGDGNDTLNGGLDNDSLAGGNGNDLLIGAKGRDTLTGSAGADTFVFSGKWGRDTVTDFNPNQVGEVLRISGASEATDFASFIAASKEVGANLVYDAGNDGVNVITLLNTAISDLSSDDLVFV